MTEQETELLKAAAAVQAAGAGTEEGNKGAEAERRFEELLCTAKQAYWRSKRRNEMEERSENLKGTAVICAAAAAMLAYSTLDETRMILWSAALVITARFMWIDRIEARREEATTPRSGGDEYKAALRICGTVFCLAAVLTGVSLGLGWLQALESPAFPAVGAGLLGMVWSGVGGCVIWFEGEY